MSDLITDMKVINGGWRATLSDGATIEVTDKEVAWAGCAQDAVMIKARDRNIVPEPQVDSRGWMYGLYCGLRPVSWGDAYEYLVDPGDLMVDPLPEGRAAAGRVSQLGGVIVGGARLKVTHLATGHLLQDVAYVDATKGYVIVIAPGSAYVYARIDGIETKIERAW